MTAYYLPDTIDALKTRAAAEPCTCILISISPDDTLTEPCLACLIRGLQPTVEAHEVPW